TCFNRTHKDHTEIFEVRDAASLLPGSPQAGVVDRTVSSAIGHVLERSTERAGGRLAYATFGYDRSGQRTSMTRFRDPVNQTSPVRWSWRFDSLGQMIQMDEPQAATRSFAYSDWSEPIETRWL